MKVNTRKLKKLREKKGYNQLDMAAHLFISQSAYSKIEIGKTSLYLEVAYKIAHTLEFKIEDFVDVPEVYSNIKGIDTTGITSSNSLNEKKNQLFLKRILDSVNELRRVIKNK